MVVLLFISIMVIGVFYNIWYQNKYYKPVMEENDDLQIFHKIGMVAAVLFVIGLISHNNNFLVICLIIFAPIILYYRFKIDFLVWKKFFKK
jgi:hypothetical protein